MNLAISADSATRIDRQNHSISMQRAFDASREQIFEAWTIPEHVMCWWDPTGAQLTACEIDLRSGGRFRFINQGGHGAPAFEEVYR